jgi:hypothetical protein
MAEGLRDADVVMMLRLQKERMDGAFIPSEREYYHRFGLDAEKLGHAKPDAIVMHPGPDEPGGRDRRHAGRRHQPLGDPGTGGDGRRRAHGGDGPSGAEPAHPAAGAGRPRRGPAQGRCPGRRAAGGTGAARRSSEEEGPVPGVKSPSSSRSSWPSTSCWTGSDGPCLDENPFLADDRSSNPTSVSSTGSGATGDLLARTRMACRHRHGAGMAILWAMGNPHVWTGAIGGLAAIAVRALYLASDETRMEWHLTNRAFSARAPRHRAGQHHDRAVAVLRRAGGDRDGRQAPAEIPGRRAGRDRDHRGAGGHPHMTNALLHNARLIDPEAGTETLGWLRIEGGEIAETGEGPRRAGSIAAGSASRPGIVDVGVKVGEPGERHKESLRTAAARRRRAGSRRWSPARHADPHRHARGAGFRHPPRPRRRARARPARWRR